MARAGGTSPQVGAGTTSCRERLVNGAVTSPSLVLAKDMNINDFASGPYWCYRFMQRNRLSIRARTTVCQKLPADFQAEVDSFRELIENQVT